MKGLEPNKDRVPQDAALEQPWMAFFSESLFGSNPFIDGELGMTKRKYLIFLIPSSG